MWRLGTQKSRPQSKESPARRQRRVYFKTNNSTTKLLPREELARMNTNCACWQHFRSVTYPLGLGDVTHYIMRDSSIGGLLDFSLLGHPDLSSSVLSSFRLPALAIYRMVPSALFGWWSRLISRFHRFCQLVSSLSISHSTKCSSSMTILSRSTSHNGEKIHPKRLSIVLFLCCLPCRFSSSACSQMRSTLQA